VRIVNHLPPSGETINLVRPAEIKKKGSTESETVSRMVKYTDMKDAAPQLFQVENEMRQNVFKSSRLERLRIQQAAEISRKLPVVKSR
jgi:anaerobic magnesium-protoporphyrin IX monomethyl ester cyclase